MQKWRTIVGFNRCMMRSASRGTTQAMKLHLAAALSLVAWYLIVPPVSRYLPDGIDPNCPLYRWPQVGAAYATVADCEAASMRASENAKSESDQLLFARLGFSRCLSSDDPRLGPR